MSPHPCQVGCILDILTMVFMDVWIFEAVSCHSLSTAGLGLFGCAGTGLQVQHACWVHLSGRGAGCRPVLAAESHVRGPHSIWDRVEDNGCIYHGHLRRWAILWAVSRIWGDLSGQQQASIGQTMFLGTCFSSRKKRKAVLKKACMR